MYKAGDVVPCRVRLLNTSGTPQVYADKTAFLAAGYVVQYDIAGVLVAATWAFAVVDSAKGDYDIMLTVQEGVGHLTCTPPTGLESWPINRPISAEAYNLGSIVGLVTATNGTPINQERTTTYAFDLVEGDSFMRTVTVPLLALQDWGFDDLTDTGWLLSSAARKRENRLAANPDFVLSAYITDAANRLVTIAMNPFADGASLSAADATNETQSYLVDLQLRNTLIHAVIGVDTGAQKFTIAGDKRKLFSFNTTPATTIAIDGSTANDNTYTVTAVALVGGNTEITVSEAIPDATVDGDVQISIKFTPIRMTVTTGRQEDRT